jgi:hypothetical protein
MAASSATASAASAAISKTAKTVATARNTSAIVRTVLATSAATGTSAMRFADIFAAVKQQVPDMSKTHFRESVMGNMHVRGEVS